MLFLKNVKSFLLCLFFILILGCSQPELSTFDESFSEIDSKEVENSSKLLQEKELGVKFSELDTRLHTLLKDSGDLVVDSGKAIQEIYETSEILLEDLKQLFEMFQHSTTTSSDPDLDAFEDKLDEMFKEVENLENLVE